MYCGQAIDERDGGQGVEGHREGIALCGAFLGKDDVVFNEKVSWNTVDVPQYSGYWWADVANIVEGCAAVQRVEGIGHVCKENCFCRFPLKALANGMNSSLAS